MSASEPCWIVRRPGETDESANERHFPTEKEARGAPGEGPVVSESKTPTPTPEPVTDGRPRCGMPCLIHDHDCDRSPNHTAMHRDVQQKGDHSCEWAEPGVRHMPVLLDLAKRLRRERDEARNTAEQVLADVEVIAKERDNAREDVAHLGALARRQNGLVAELRADAKRLRTEVEEERDACSEVMRERDEHVELLDQFAGLVAPVEVIGEHSSGNDPWANAMDLVTPAVEVEAICDARDAAREQVKAFATVIHSAPQCGEHEQTSDPYCDTCHVCDTIRAALDQARAVRS